MAWSNVYNIILSPFDNFQSDLMQKIKRNSVFSKHVDAKIVALLETFTTDELIQWGTIDKKYTTAYFSKPAVFANEENTKNLHKRIIEHNLRVINKYYSFIELSRLALFISML